MHLFPLLVTHGVVGNDSVILLRQSIRISPSLILIKPRLLRVVLRGDVGATIGIRVASLVLVDLVALAIEISLEHVFLDVLGGLPSHLNILNVPERLLLEDIKAILQVPQAGRSRRRALHLVVGEERALIGQSFLLHHC